MTRIFTILALFAFALFEATLALGLFLGDIRHDPAALRWKVIHNLSGLLAALTVVLLHSIAVTYFIGTTRWCKEVAEAYRLDAALTARATAVKRRAFTWAIPSMLTVVAIAGLGAAADPSNTLIRHSEAWTSPHLWASLIGGVFLLVAFAGQLKLLRAQHQVIMDVLAEVKRIRLERGLDEQQSPDH